MTNKTSCQIEILNLDARVSVEFTKQDENMDHSADGATYKAKVKNLMKNIFVEVIFLIQTGEFVTLSVNVEAGLPVFYEIFWEMELQMISTIRQVSIHENSNASFRIHYLLMRR